MSPPPLKPGDADPAAAFETLGRDLRQAIDSAYVPIAAPADQQTGARPRRAVRDRAAPMPGDGAVAGGPEAEAATGGNPFSKPAHPSGQNSTLDEIRALLDRFEPGSTFSSLERRMEDLAAKIDRGMEPQSPSKQIEDLARQIDEIHSSIQGQAGFPAIEPSSVEALVRGIADRIEAAREASADIQRLEGLIKGLADKIDDGNVQSDQGAVAALEAQMSRLGDRLERSEASLSSLDGVERSLGELFAQLEETRHATIDAAENAARTAARDTLRAAMQNPPVQPGSADGESGIIGQVTQELSELRGIHDASSRRTQSTLMDLHQTMERLVEHLARLDIAGRPAGASWQPTNAAAASSNVEEGQARPSRAAPPVRAAAGVQEQAQAGDAGRRQADVVDPVDSLIEPGLGRASLSKLSPAGVALPSGESEGPASFIAAARRAAHAAQASAAATQRPANRGRISGDPTSMTTLSSLERARHFLVQRRRPILLGLAGLVLLLGALEVAKLGFVRRDGAGAERRGRVGRAKARRRSAGQRTEVGSIPAKPALASPELSKADSKTDVASLNAPASPLSASPSPAGQAAASASTPAPVAVPAATPAAVPDPKGAALRPDPWVIMSGQAP